MTISATRGTKWTHDQLVLRALQLAGLADAGASTGDNSISSMMAMGLDNLDAILDELTTVPSARSVEFYYLTLSKDTQTYTLSESIIDLVDDGMYIDASATDVTAYTGETKVKQINRDHWQSLSDKGSTGWPTLFYAHRGGDDYQITVYLYPTPDEAGTIRFQAQYASADAKSGASTLDVKSSYNQYLLYQLAAQLALASNVDVNKVMMLESKASYYKTSARTSGAEHSDFTLRVNMRAPQRR